MLKLLNNNYCMVLISNPLWIIILTKYAMIHEIWPSHNWCNNLVGQLVVLWIYVALAISYSCFSWRVQSTNLKTHEMVIFCMNDRRKYYDTEFVIPTNVSFLFKSPKIKPSTVACKFQGCVEILEILSPELDRWWHQKRSSAKSKYSPECPGD